MKNPYGRFKPDNLILRDELAIDRTLLANERTLLAYLRSGMTLILAGITFIHFAHDKWFKMIGLFCLPAGVVTMLLGIVRYHSMNSKIKVARQLSEVEKTQSQLTTPNK